MRILTWDIETSLQPVAIFQLANNDWIKPEALLGERYIICACWKWMDEDKVHSVSVLDDPKRYKKDPHDDRYVVETLRDLLMQADVIVHHKGDSFDRPYLNTRILAHGLPALPPIPSVDTYKVAKANFFLNSNSLDYLGKFLKVGKKISVGYQLWLTILNGGPAAVKAIKEMARYCKQDVSLLEAVYLKLRPYMSGHPNGALYGGDGCPLCGCTRVQSRGTYKAISRVYPRFQCQGCFKWLRGEKNDRTIKTKYRIL